MNPEEKPTLQPLNVAPAPAVAATSTVNPAQTVPVAPAQTSSVVGAEYASVYSRFMAVSIDGLVMIVIILPFYIVFGLLSNFALKGNAMLLMFMPLVLWVFQLAVFVYYLCIYQHKNGQTIGRKTMHIKTVLMLDGSTPSAGKFLLREIIFKMLSSILMIGYLMAIFDAKKQALHDKLAGTVVIKV